MVSVLVILGVDTKYLTWLPIKNYIFILFTVVKLAQIMVVLKIYNSVLNPEEAAMIKLIG